MCDDPLGFGFPRALANLYEDPEWSQKDLAGPTESLKAQVTKSKLGVLAPSQLQQYRQELAERARLGHPPCFTTLWALMREALLHDEVQGAGCVARAWFKDGEPPWAAEMGKAPGTRKHNFRFKSSPSTSPMTILSQTRERP